MTAALEDIKIIDIEDWGSLNTAASSTKLQNGQTPNMENVWTDEKPGSVITANGFIKVGTSPSGNPSSFCINYFKTSDGSQTFVLSDNATVWTTVDFQNFTSIKTGLSSSFQLRGKVVRDKLWLTNGSDAVMTWDGASFTVLDGSGGTPTVPKGRYIDYYDERVWLYHISGARSQSAFSALTDSTGVVIAPDNANAWPASNTLQVSEGDADFGTGLLLYRGYLHFFKQYSIWRLVGYDEYTYTRVKTRASTGTRFNESIQVGDSIVHFIGIDGIYVFDGEETVRISDIVDPTTASQSSFGFNQLQQPNANNQFWETSDTADWNTASVSIPTNLSTASDRLTLLAADDSQADFAAGNTLTNVTATDNSGSLQLTTGSTGASLTNVALNQSATLTPVSGSGIIGVASYLTDGNFTNVAGVTTPHPNGILAITLNTAAHLTTVLLKSFRSQGGQSTISFTRNGSTSLPVVSVSPSSGGGMSLSVSGGQITVTGGAGSPTTPIDLTVTFSSFTATSLEAHFVNDATGSSPLVTVTEVQILTAAYSATGQFISKALDLGATPTSIGTFDADITVPSGTTALYFTQSSADGSSWDAAVAVTNGGSVGSTPRRYLRWRVDFTSDGSATPVIGAVYLASQYISAIHNTGGSISAWGALEADYSLAAQTITFYYRAASTSAGVTAASWNVIVPGGVLSTAITNTFIQFKLEYSGGTPSNIPYVVSVTFNWLKGTNVQAQILQNVASYFWRNRYWLSAAGPSATANDTILIRGKKTYGSPWQLKDWPILSFARYQDALYGCSSTNGDILQLDTGYSKNGSTIDAFFETGDYIFGGFFADIIEVLIEVERMGPYDLSVGLSIDRGITFREKTVDLSLTGGALSYTKRLNFSLNCDRIRARVRINGTDKPFQVHRMKIFYKLNAARGSVN